MRFSRPVACSQRGGGTVGGMHNRSILIHTSPLPPLSSPRRTRDAGTLIQILLPILALFLPIEVGETLEVHAFEEMENPVADGPSNVDEGDDTTPQNKDVDSHKDDALIDDDRDKNGSNSDHRTNGEDGSTPHIGKAFKSYGEACYFYKQYAQLTGFGATVRNSLFTKSGECTKLVLACSKCRKARGEPLLSTKTDCPASIRLKLQGDGLLHLVKAKLEHNHPLNPSMKEKCYKKLSNAKVRRPNRLCYDLLQAEEDLSSVQKECEISTRRGHMKLGEGNDEAIAEFFTRMQTMYSNFFYLVDLDEEGRLRNVFWADPMSRSACRYFGDVISFDTTCFINKSRTPLVLFLGVNHHGQPVLLGCGLLSDETTETYVWLFKAWLACMLGRSPNAIITDQSRAIQDAVALVFPKARRRFCLWNLMRRMPEKVRGFAERDVIKKAFKKAVYDSLRADDFEKEWRDMIENHGLQRSEWCNLLYENRHSWVPVYLKDTFWAGMCTAGSCESMAAFFDGVVHSETSLSEFVRKYDAALQSKYEKETRADFESLHRNRQPISKFYMEEQLSTLYTYNMFKKFQDELKATMYCDVSLIKIDGLISAFQVKESVFLDDGIETEIKEHEVLYDANEVQVQCICGSFQFQGILCRHALSVLKLQQVYEIPSNYIVNRWRKDYKRLNALDRSSTDVLTDNLMERYGYLSMRCLQLVDVGVISDEKYHLALKLIGEVDKLLLDDSTTGDGQSKSVLPRSRLNEKNKSLALSQSFTSKGDKVVNPLQVKRRGRPPKKRKEPNTETIDGSNNIMESSRALLAGNQNNVVRVSTTGPHLGRHIRTQGGIDLMEDANPNHLSFDTHFGVQDNNQHHIGNPLGMQFNNTIQGQFNQQTIGNHSMPWFHQQVSQEDQIPKAPLGRRNVY